MNASVTSEKPQAGTAGRAAGGVIFGRFMLPDHSEHPCRIGGITPDSAEIITDARIENGARIVAYIDEIGRVEGVAEAVRGEGFTLVFSLTPARREKIVRRLEWLSGNARGENAEQRRHPRYQPKDSKSAITLADGRSYPCEVLDISLSGASVRTHVLPAIGTHVMLGKTHGRVVRHHENGLGVEFVRPIDQNTLRRHIDGE